MVLVKNHSLVLVVTPQMYLMVQRSHHDKYINNTDGNNNCHNVAEWSLIMCIEKKTTVIVNDKFALTIIGEYDFSRKIGWSVEAEEFDMHMEGEGDVLVWFVRQGGEESIEAAAVIAGEEVAIIDGELVYKMGLLDDSDLYDSIEIDRTMMEPRRSWSSPSGEREDDTVRKWWRMGDGDLPF